MLLLLGLCGGKRGCSRRDPVLQAEAVGRYLGN
jgi:hypothetical protein